MQKTAASEKILIVLHQEASSPGKLGQMLKAKGFELDIRKPRFGDPLPETMQEHAGSIIFGGPMSANDTDDFIRRETDWIGVPLKEGAPFFGICLGAQMLVKHLGGTVSSHCDGCAEVGFYKLHATEAGRQLVHWPSMVYQWHREGFDLPSEATLLARGDIFENQAFSVNGTAFGIQFHSELTYAMACRWTVRGAHRFALPMAQSRPEHMAGWFRYDPPIRAWLGHFLDVWLKQDKRDRAARRVGQADATPARAHA
jgi:GMP synthase (glutamine-hydrolysing)